MKDVEVLVKAALILISSNIFKKNLAGNKMI